jgi:hypothetical protein
MPIAQALVRGDWRTAIRHLFSGQRLGGTAEAADMAKCLRYVALSMGAQCAASNVALAKKHLDNAADLLCSVATRRQQSSYEMHQLRQLTALLLEREQADLAAVHRTFSTCAKGRQELVQACAEYLIWVANDPYTVLAPADDQELLEWTTTSISAFGPSTAPT